jgi:hypothetical protein
LGGDKKTYTLYEEMFLLLSAPRNKQAFGLSIRIVALNSYPRTCLRFRIDGVADDSLWIGVISKCGGGGKVGGTKHVGEQDSSI